MTTSNPYQAPNADVVSASNETYQPKVFTAKGRIGRLRYLAYGFLSYLIAIPIFGIIGLLVAMGGGSESGGPGVIGGIGLLLGVLAYIAIAVYAFILAKRRFNDVGQSGWLSLLLLVPLVNIIVGLFLIFAPGKPESNQYGQPPAKNSNWVVAGALGLPIFVIFVGIIAAVSVPAYQDYVERAQQAELELLEAQ